MATNNVFTLNDGTEELVITNKFGREIGRIHVRTGDISIVDRYNAFMKDFDKIIAPLKNISINADGTSSFEDEWAVIKGVEKELIEKLNEIFDTDDIGILFETRNAFSTIGGVFYVEKVIEMLGEVVSQAITSETEKTQKRIDKYTKDVHRKESMKK